MEKARNAYYFSTREGYDVLRGFVTGNPYDRYTWEPEPPAGKGWAITNRTLSFGGQPLFPPGIDLEKAATPGPWFDLFVYDTRNPCTEGPGPSRGGNRAFQNQSGIVWFPGSAPLYRNGGLLGGIGVSGDGVEQDDIVTAGAVAGFEPPRSCARGSIVDPHGRRRAGASPTPSFYATRHSPDIMTAQRRKNRGDRKDRREKLLGVLGVLCGFFFFVGTASAQTYQVLGKAKCINCHDHENEKVWSEKKDGPPPNNHLNALRQLETPKSETYAKAVGLGIRMTLAVATCHGTVLKGSVVDGVTCESCHGPGSGYVDVHQQKGVLAVGRCGPCRHAEESRCVGRCVTRHAEGRQLDSGGHPSGDDFDLGAKFATVALHWKSIYPNKVDIAARARTTRVDRRRARSDDRAGCRRVAAAGARRLPPRRPPRGVALTGECGAGSRPPRRRSAPP
jgi:hypothetical protein